MARRQAFVVRHPLVTVVIILAVELALIGVLHLVLGWSPLAVALVGLAVLVLGGWCFSRVAAQGARTGPAQ